MLSLTRTPLWLRRLLAGIPLVALVALAFVAVTLAVAPAPAQAAALFCSPNVVYGTGTNGRMYSIDVHTGAATEVANLSPANNALGISRGGLEAWGMQNNGGNGTIVRYDTVDETTRTFTSADPNAPSTIIRGAINPVNGIFYYGGNGTTAYLGAFDTVSETPIGQVGWTSGLNASPANGDFAFSSTGGLFIVSANQLLRLDERPPSTAGTPTLATTLITTLDASVNSPGIAFANDGSLYISSGQGSTSTLTELDPSSGAVLSTVRISNNVLMSDLASCSYPNTMTLVKDVVDRYGSADQFGLSITGGSIQTGNTALTEGTATGPQEPQAGPVFADAGTVYTIRETGENGASLANYASSAMCTERSSGQMIPLTAQGPGTWTLVYPDGAGSENTNVICRITNDALEPGMNLTKTATPAAGSTVSAGDTISYTVTATNTGQTVLDPASVSDDLSELLAFTDYEDDATATIDGVDAGPVKRDGATLSWTGTLAPEKAVTITYSVTVRADAAGETLRNSASTSGTPPSGRERVTPPPAETTHDVAEPGFSVAKAASPASGESVDPGQTVTYTVTGTNTGGTVLDPVTLTDDLSAVLPHADYNGDAVIAIDGEPVGTARLDGTELSWTGALAAGETATLTYTVTVHADAGGETLRNTALGSATPPGGGDPLTPPPVGTEHRVNAPGFEVTKTSDPGGDDGVVGDLFAAAPPTRVDPGQTITYTVTGANTGQTRLDPITVSDDLGEVLEHADYNEDAVATIDGEPAGQVTLTGDTLSWTGALEVGQSVTIRYSVTVHADAGGETLRNAAVGSATPPGGGDPIEPPESSTQHRVNEPGFTTAKTADPASGSAVEPGQTITYTITGTNTGETRLDPVTLTDDLSKVLRFADYNDDAQVEINDVDTGELVVDGTTLTWTGPLNVGASVAITYSVTVHAGAEGVTLTNALSGAAMPPGGESLVPPLVTTRHDVPSAPVPPTGENPAAGETPAAGELPRTGVNTGLMVGFAGLGVILLLLGILTRAARRR